MTEQPSPDQTGAWEPDQFQVELMLKRQYAMNHGDSYRIARSLIAEIKRQQADAGIVKIRRAHLERAKRMIEGILNHRARFSAEQLADINMLWRHLDRLAAATEQDR